MSNVVPDQSGENPTTELGTNYSVSNVPPLSDRSSLTLHRKGRNVDDAMNEISRRGVGPSVLEGSTPSRRVLHVDSSLGTPQEGDV